MITLRLDKDIEQNLKNAAEVLGITNSDLIRKSISEYLARLKKSSPWELGEQYFGKYSSGFGNLAEERKHLLKTKIRAKRT